MHELLASAATLLAAAGVDSPRVDAELLLAAQLGVPRSALLTHGDTPGFRQADFETLIARRAAREPLQHILGTAPFRYVEVAVGPGVFVPRPETELLVDAILPHLRDTERPAVVDLCAGSGALALAIADELPAAAVVAVENSPDALPWLTRNVTGSAAGNRVRVIAADVRDQEALRTLYREIDAVVSNPPYVPLGAQVSPEVLADPSVAVFGGGDGLSLLPAVITQSALLLRAGGVLALEHDDSHADAVPALLRDDGRWDDVTACRDLAGRPRYATARRNRANREDSK